MDNTAQINIHVSPKIFYALNMLLLGNAQNLPEPRTVEALMTQFAKDSAYGALHPKSPEAQMLRQMRYIE